MTLMTTTPNKKIIKISNLLMVSILYYNVDQYEIIDNLMDTVNITEN